MWQNIARAAGRQAGRHTRAFVQHVVPSVIKPARALWNQVIGFVFLCLAVPCGAKAVRYAMAADHARLLIATVPTLLLAWFGIYSLLLARRISRS